MKMLAKIRQSKAFSLVEVVLAIGIISIGLLAIFGLFGVTLNSNKEVVEQDEVLAVGRALPEFLQTQGFATVYGWIQSATTPKIYAYSYAANTGDTPQLKIGTSLDATFITNAASRKERLFRIKLALSPNNSITLSQGPPATYKANPAVSDLPAIASYYDAALALQVTVYPVASTSAPDPTGLPLSIYDTTVNR